MSIPTGFSNPTQVKSSALSFFVAGKNSLDNLLLDSTGIVIKAIPGLSVGGLARASVSQEGLITGSATVY